MELTQMVGQVGFPIAVALWLLIRLGATRSPEIQAMA